MKTDLIDFNDACSYVMPISNIIGKRINRLATLNKKLNIIINKLYMIPDESDKNDICLNISKIISEMELLILKNIDDSQILEYTLAEFTMNPPPVEKPEIKPNSDHQAYFA
jgi:hypothetical protein